MILFAKIMGHMYIFKITIPIFVIAFTCKDVFERYKQLRNRVKLVKILLSGDKILEIKEKYNQITFEIEHRSYGEEKSTFSLSQEIIVFRYKTMYTTNNKSKIININNAVLTIPYIEDV